MSLPSVPEPFRRPFQGWSLPQYMLDGSLSMLLTLLGSVVLELTRWQTALLAGLSVITISSEIMLWLR